MLFKGHDQAGGAVWTLALGKGEQAPSDFGIDM